jgi:hypothetical protein
MRGMGKGPLCKALLRAIKQQNYVAFIYGKHKIGHDCRFSADTSVYTLPMMKRNQFIRQTEGTGGDASPAILTKIFRDIPQSLQVNTSTAPLSVHDSVLPNHFPRR